MLYQFDHMYAERGFNAVCGVDEAGRGPLAGPVYAAAVILPPDKIEGLNDSKKISAGKREKLYDIITGRAVAYAVGVATRDEIDAINILNASLLAMKRALDALAVGPDCVLVDGNVLPDRDGPHMEAVVGGDARNAVIAAASIIAKVSRDRHMRDMDLLYPQYEFAKHKGYPTKRHYECLDTYGPSPIHRVSFLKKWAAKGGML